MPLAAPPLPVATLLLGAVFLLLSGNLIQKRAAQMLAIGVPGIALLSAGALYLSHPTVWTAELWRPESTFGLEMGYYADSVSILFAVLLTVVAFSVLLGDLHVVSARAGGVETLGMLFLALGAACSLILAGDLVSLCLSWGLLDIALLAIAAKSQDGRQTAAALRLLLVNFLGGVALVGGLVALQARGGGFSLHEAPMPALVISLMMVAAFLRLRLYPTFLERESSGQQALSARVLWYVIPVVVGGYLMVRALGLAAVTSLPGSGLGLVLASLSIALSPFGLWFEAELEKAAPYIVLNQAGHMALAAVIGAPYSPAIICCQVVTLVFALASLFLGQRASCGSISRSCEMLRRCGVWVAIAALVGTPLTVGFVGRQLLYGSLVGSRLAALVFVMLAANTFIVPPLLKMGLAGAPVKGERDGMMLWRLAGVTVTSLPLVVFGLFPGLLGRLLGIQSALAPWPTLMALVYSAESVVPSVLSAVTVAPLALGYLMYRQGPLIVDKAGDSLETLHAVAKGEWLYAGVGQLVELVATVVENAGGFFEGRRSAGWILVFATLAALLLLSS